MNDAVEGGAPVGRRIVIGLAALGAVGIVGGSAVQSRLARWLAPIQNADPTGLLGLFPLGATFRYYSIVGSVPRRDAASYGLEVGGLVRNPTTYGLAELESMPQTMLTRDFQCVTGWRVPEVPWRGVRLRDILDAAGPMPEAKAITFASFDGAYTESLTLEQARRDDVIVALQMLGGAVTHDHGGPVRLYVAPMYGYKSVKWLSSITLTTEVVPGYWEAEGSYDIDAWIGDSNGRDDDPVG